MSRKDEREQRLDALLEKWAIGQMLPRTQSESIRLAVLQVPKPTLTTATEISISWWHQLFGTLDSVLGRTTDISRYLNYR